MNKLATISVCLMGTLPLMANAQDMRTSTGPTAGDREITLSGTGSSDSDFDSSTAGITGDYGWYRNDMLSWGIRQSVNYASIEGADLTDDYWNGSTRGYINQHFLQDKFRPFIGASLGAVYGDGVEDGGFAGLEFGQKYYVLPSTFVLARAEYQWFFDSSSNVDDNFSDGAFAYTVGIGYNF